MAAWWASSSASKLCSRFFGANRFVTIQSPVKLGFIELFEFVCPRVLRGCRGQSPLHLTKIGRRCRGRPPSKLGPIPTRTGRCKKISYHIKVLGVFLVPYVFGYCKFSCGFRRASEGVPPSDTAPLGVFVSGASPPTPLPTNPNLKKTFPSGEMSWFSPPIPDRKPHRRCPTNPNLKTSSIVYIVFWCKAKNQRPRKGALVLCFTLPCSAITPSSWWWVFPRRCRCRAGN